MPASGFGHACDEMGVANLVRDAARQGLTVRATGTGHSFSALCVSDGLLLSLDRLRGVVAADASSRTAVMRAGTPLHELGVPLRAAGLAMETMGDIDRQTLAGAISTGTHGSGPTLGNISTQVVGLLLVTADGEIVDCSAEREPELFRAARVSLRALGVIEVRLASCLSTGSTSGRGAVPSKSAWQRSIRSCCAIFFFFWRPLTDACDMKTLNATSAAPARPHGPASASITATACCLLNVW